MSKRLLSLADLYNFYVQQGKNVKFSSKNSDSEIVVHIKEPFRFEKQEEDELNLYTYLQFCHTEKNLNQSYISKVSMEDAIPTAYNMPILGYIWHDEESDLDKFAGHEMYIEDGEIVYQEIPIGCVPESANLQLVESGDEDGKMYLEGTGIIWKTYTKAAEIMKREKTLSVSVELSIEDLSYNAKDKVLIIDKFKFSGVTILQENPETNKEIKPGMAGANISIADFSKQNNSIFSREEIVELVKETIKQSFNINQNNENSEKGGKEQLKLKELLKKYNKTEKDIKFEYDGLSDEELEAKFAECFDETEGEDSGESGGEGTGESGENGESGTGGTEDSGEEDGESGSGEDDEDSGDTENDTGKETGNESDSDNDDDEDGEDGEDDEEESSVSSDDETSNKKKKKFQRVYELSHNDIRCGLYALLAPFEENDGDYYWITDVYDDHFVYEGWVNEGAIYDQKYSKDGDNLSFEGDRVHLNKEYLTDNELVALKEMRSNYAKFEEIQAKLEKYESEPKKMEILESSDWDNIRGTEAFANISKEENHFDLSADELSKALNEMLLEFSKGHKIEFSSKEDAKPTKTVSMKQLPVNKKRSGGKSRYGGIFSDKNED